MPGHEQPLLAAGELDFLHEIYLDRCKKARLITRDILYISL